MNLGTVFMLVGALLMGAGVTGLVVNNQTTHSWRGDAAAKACQNRGGMYELRSRSETRIYTMCMDGSTHWLEK
jgi:hypothetical protein